MSETDRPSPRLRFGMLVSLLCLAWLPCVQGCGESPPPNLLLLLSVDTLRADRLGVYGSELGLTPNLDALASESVVFTRAYAVAPITLPSVAAVLTGRHPEELGIFRNESLVPESIPTLASLLRVRGWHTAAVVSNYILRRSSGIAKGFDSFDDTFPQLEAVRKWPERIASDTTDAALAQLDRCTAAPDARCFLWVHYQDPHGPYTPPGNRRARELEREAVTPDADRLLPVGKDHEGIGAIPDYQYLEKRRDVGFYRAGYHAEIRYFDEEAGRLLREVAERRPRDRTVIVFASDHGEGLGERDYWFAHGEYLTDPLVRVPLFLRVPGVAPQRRADVVSSIDLLPTLLAALGETQTDFATAGRDLLAPDAAQESSRPYLATRGGARTPRFGIIEGGYKFVISERDGIWDGELTRLDREDVDLTAAAPQIARSMRGRLQEVRQQMERGLAEVRQELSEAELDNLRALGYADDGS